MMQAEQQKVRKNNLKVQLEILENNLRCPFMYGWMLTRHRNKLLSSPVFLWAVPASGGHIQSSASIQASNPLHPLLPHQQTPCPLSPHT